MTNALGWVAATPPSWFPPVATRGPGRALPAADGPRRARGVLRDHRGGRGHRRRRDRGDRLPRRRLLGAQRREVARHVASTPPTTAFFQAKKTDDPERRAACSRRRALALPRRPAEPRGVRRPHARLLAHDQPPPPDRRVRERPRSRGQPGRRGGRRDALLARVVPLRAADGGGPLRRRRGAPGRGDERVRRGPRRRRRRRSRARPGRGHARGQRHGAVRGPLAAVRDGPRPSTATRRTRGPRTRSAR